jgi:hypothetical protein
VTGETDTLREDAPGYPVEIAYERTEPVALVELEVARIRARTESGTPPPPPRLVRTRRARMFAAVRATTASDPSDDPTDS